MFDPQNLLADIARTYGIAEDLESTNVTIRGNHGQYFCYPPTDPTLLVPAWVLSGEISRVGTDGYDHVAKVSRWVAHEIDHTETHESNAHDTATIEAAIPALTSNPAYTVARTTGGKGLSVKIKVDAPAETKAHHAANRRAAKALMSPSIKALLDPRHAGVVWCYSSTPTPTSYEVLSTATTTLELGDVPAPKERERKPIELKGIHHTLIRACQLNDHGDYFSGHGVLIKEGLALLGLSTRLETGCSDLSSDNLQVFIEHDDFVDRGCITIRHFGEDGDIEHIPLNLRFDAVCRGHRLAEADGKFSGTQDQWEPVAEIFDLDLPAVPDHGDQPRLITIESESRGVVKATTTKHGVSDCLPGFSSKPAAREQSLTLRFDEGSPDVSGVRDTIARYLRDPVLDDPNANVWQIKTPRGWIAVKDRDVRYHLEISGHDPSPTIAELQCQYIDVVSEHWQPQTVQGDTLNLRGIPMPMTRPGDTTICELVTAHLGKHLESGIRRSDWCQRHGVDGKRYVELWQAGIVQRPYDAAPALSLNSHETGTGKSTLPDAMRILVGPKYCTDIANELGGMFSGHLRDALIGTCEEVNARPHLDKIKDLITSRYLTIRAMRQNQVSVRNSLHLIFTGNDFDYVPVDYDERRVTVFDPLTKPTKKISPTKMTERLQAERLAWIHYLKSLPIPPQDEGMDFYLPVLETDTLRNILAGTMPSKPKRNDPMTARFMPLIENIIQDLPRVTPGEVRAQLPEPKPSANQVADILRQLNWDKPTSRSRHFVPSTGA